MDDYFNSMSDEQVLQIARMVDTDLTDAAENQCGSEWHQECFAAAFITAQEMNKRGIKLQGK